MSELFDEIFKNTEPYKPVQMTADEFIIKAKKLLNSLSSEYNSAWFSRRITDAEYSIAPCEGCKGDGCFKNGEKEVRCVADREEGECYERCFDGDQFLDAVENDIIYGHTPFFDLIECTIKKETPKT